MGKNSVRLDKLVEIFANFKVGSPILVTGLTVRFHSKLRIH